MTSKMMEQRRKPRKILRKLALVVCIAFDGYFFGAFDEPHLAAINSQRVRILHMLARSELGRFWLRTVDDDDDEDLGRYGLRRRRRRDRPNPNRFPKVPSDEGTTLMNSGTFGANEIKSFNSITRKKRLARRILDRELGIDSGPTRKVNQQLMAQVRSILIQTKWQR
jgi:hypothetical protein